MNISTVRRIKMKKIVGTFIYPQGLTPNFKGSTTHARSVGVSMTTETHMQRKELAKAIFKIAHLTGEFKLRSGLMSKEYFDKYRFESQPKILREIAVQMKELIPPGVDA